MNIEHLDYNFLLLSLLPLLAAVVHCSKNFCPSCNLYGLCIKASCASHGFIVKCSEKRKTFQLLWNNCFSAWISHTIQSFVYIVGSQSTVVTTATDCVLVQNHLWFTHRLMFIHMWCPLFNCSFILSIPLSVFGAIALVSLSLSPFCVHS